MSTTEWILIRATGMSAVVALTASMVLGLMMSLKMRPKRWPAVVTNDLHQFVTSLALWITGAHLALLVVDSASGITPLDLVVPFRASSQTIAMGLGTLAVLALAVVWLTSVYRSRIGHARWRMIHYAAFAAYGMSIAHGVFGGTDTSQRWAWPVYAASVGIVGWLMAKRIAGRTRQVSQLPAAQMPRRVAPVAQRTLPPTVGAALPVIESRHQSAQRRPVRL